MIYGNLKTASLEELRSELVYTSLPMLGTVAGVPKWFAAVGADKGFQTVMDHVYVQDLATTSLEGFHTVLTGVDTALANWKWKWKYEQKVKVKVRAESESASLRVKDKVRLKLEVKIEVICYSNDMKSAPFAVSLVIITGFEFKFNLSKVQSKATYNQ